MAAGKLAGGPAILISYEGQHTMKFASLLTLLAVVAVLSGAAVGQTTATGLQSYTGPPTYLGVYDLTTQSFGPAPGGDAGSLIYDNTVPSGSFFPSGAGIVNMDWGDQVAWGCIASLLLDESGCMYYHLLLSGSYIVNIVLCNSYTNFVNPVCRGNCIVYGI